jgi:hypothetical protein
LPATQSALASLPVFQQNRPVMARCVWYALDTVPEQKPREEAGHMSTLDNESDLHPSQQDDSDADAFAVLSLLVIIAAAIVYYINH